MNNIAEMYRKRIFYIVYSIIMSNLMKVILLRSFSAYSRVIDKNVVVVIGGGAAGYFSSIECARILCSTSSNKQHEVYILEASQHVLSKVLISGGGRCNVMHNPIKGPSEIAKGYPRGYRELLGPYNVRFGPWETYDWFTKQGVELKTEIDGRVFPITDKSTTISETLQQAAKVNGVSILKGAKVSKIIRLRNSFPIEDVDSSYHTEDIRSNMQYEIRYQQGSSRAILPIEEGFDQQQQVEEGSGSTRVEKSIVCDRVIIATGSSRVGYDILKELGHNLENPLPSLFSFKIQDSNLTALSGVSSKYSKVKLVLPRDFSTGPNKSLLRSLQQQQNLSPDGPMVQRGPLLITKQGLSGPSVLKLSAFGARILAALNYKFTIEVSWVGDLALEELIEHFNNEKKIHPTRSIGKCFPHLKEEMINFIKDQMGSSTIEDDSIPNSDAITTTDDIAAAAIDQEEEESNLISKRLWLYLLQRAQITPQLKWKELSNIDVIKIADQVIKGSYAVEGRGLYRDEFVTCGGVSLKEVNFNTMESKKCPGIYLAGEVLDIDGITGGYNFQSAWSTGYIAGHSCGTSLLTPSSSSSSLMPPEVEQRSQ